jgi:hypothetical protein
MVLIVGETEREFISNYLLKKGITRNNVIIGFQIGAVISIKFGHPKSLHYSSRDFYHMDQEFAS